MRSILRCVGPVTLFVLAMASPAFAAPSVTVSAVAGATNLDLDGDGASSTHIVKVADVAMSTDGSNGFTLSISSGGLTRAGGTSIAFQVTLVADGAAAPGSSAFTVSSGATYTFSTAAAGPDEGDLYVMYTPANLQDPGPYQATIDLSIVDN